MALETIAQQSSYANSLFRPVPLSKLQQNLAQFYEKTSNYVNEHFHEMAAPGEAGTSSTKKLFSEESETSEYPRLNPHGVGQFIDIRV